MTTIPELQRILDLDQLLTLRALPRSVCVFSCFSPPASFETCGDPTEWSLAQMGEKDPLLKSILMFDDLNLRNDVTQCMDRAFELEFAGNEHNLIRSLKGQLTNVEYHRFFASIVVTTMMVQGIVFGDTTKVPEPCIEYVVRKMEDWNLDFDRGNDFLGFQ